MASFKSEFVRRFTNFKKILNNIQLLNSSLTLQFHGEWVNEETSVFKCVKASLKM